MIRRRGLILGGATLAAGAGVARGAWLWRARRFDFRPLASPPGFREIPRAAISTGATALIGIDTPKSAPVALAGDPCAALFPSRRSGTIPVAAFTDVACAICRVLTPILADFSRAGDIDLNWQEFPVFGRPSVAAARAALAADMQGKGTEFRLRLMRTSFVATPAYLRALSTSLDLDAGRLLADAKGASVNEKLAISQALAHLFGLPGTPALVVGRTLVVGAISRARLEALVALERKESGAPCG